ncbi:chorion class CB protein PC404-like [Galleria mellonella]|uniref:Chorion class CB protein PC404-like n=1 Tax=Galleria mellonella TaxID=7137 RepID=A0ABM3MSQ3_GALME|nr:chorion class CB protein PC404-like [Galleria mellonella]
MAAKIVFVLCLQALFIQSLLGNPTLNRRLPSAISGISGATVVENTVAVSNNAIGGIGLANNGLIGTGLGLANTGLIGSGIGLANTGLIGTGVGLANAGLIGSGVGLANTGIVGTGLAGVGLANPALIGNAILPTPATGFLDFATITKRDNLPIFSFSPLAPTGLTVVSENIIEGPMAVAGQLPFLSAVAFEGALPTAGAGAAGCGCGNNGYIGIINENYGPLAPPALGGLGYGPGIGHGVAPLL